MGTLAAFIPIFGIFAGYVVSLFTKQEIKNARQHLIFLFHALILAALSLNAYLHRTLALYALALVFALFTAHTTYFKQRAARWTTAFLGLFAGSNIHISSLSFIALLVLGSLHKPKELILPAALYLLAVTISLLARL